MSLTRPVAKIRMPATTKELAAMLEEASRTARKLPPAGPRGYASIWPQIPRSASERFATDDRPVFFPPSGAAIDRMLACFEWVSALEEGQRHLLWKRASHEPWKDICAWMGCDRTTAWRRWNGALEAVLGVKSSAPVRHAREIRSDSRAMRTAAPREGQERQQFLATPRCACDCE
jgi:hypothetical protein